LPLYHANLEQMRYDRNAFDRDVLSVLPPDIFPSDAAHLPSMLDDVFYQEWAWDVLDTASPRRETEQQRAEMNHILQCAHRHFVQLINSDLPKVTEFATRHVTNLEHADDDHYCGYRWKDQCSWGWIPSLFPWAFERSGNAFERLSAMNLCSLSIATMPKSIP
jgi:hypothetical protein